MLATSRRRFLAMGAAGAGLLGVGGGLAWVTVGYRLGAGDAALGLSVKELAIVRAIVDALLPAEDGLPSGLEVGVHQRVDEEVWAAPASVRSDLKAAIQLLEHLPPVYGFPGRFSRLSNAQREACFRRYLAAGPTPVVQAAVALKQLTHLFYYASDPTWPAIGYDGPWIGEARPHESAVAYAALLHAARRGA